MENVKKQLQENQMFRNMFIAFVTFFLMIVAIMSNSIVSALDINYGGKTYSYPYYVEIKYYYAHDNRNYIAHFYYNNYTTVEAKERLYFYKADGSEITYGNDYYVYEESLNKDDSVYSTLHKDFNESWIGTTNCNNLYIDSTSSSFKCLSVKTNDSNVVNALKKYKNAPKDVTFQRPPLITEKTVGGILPAIKKTLQVIIPVGLVIFGAILGIYLIKRLVALFL